MPKKLIIAVFVVCSFTFHGYPHGIHGHIWVTDGAIGELKDPELVEFFRDPRVREAAQIGAAFPDSGYALKPKHSYAETAHWEPFVESYIQYLRKNLSFPIDTLEEKKQAAFLLGLASHGMEDEIFDSLYMFKSEEVESGNQDILDPGTDFMLIADGHAKLQPAVYFPEADLIKVFGSPAVGVQVTGSDMQKGMSIVATFVIPLSGMGTKLIPVHRAKLPWTKDHYLDPDTPGSLKFEVFVVTRYMQTLWDRLHGRFSEKEMIIYSVPVPGKKLLSVSHKTVDSWITFFLGCGALNDTLHSGIVRFTDATGNIVPADIKNTRWGGKGDYSRLLQIRPRQDLLTDADYTVTLSPGIKLITGQSTTRPVTFHFKTP